MMFINKCMIFQLTILNVFEQAQGLAGISHHENDILKTASSIRSTTNKLFLKLKLKGVKEKPKLKQYTIIHNYFMSVTIQDNDILKQISEISTVDKRKIDNGTANFIVLLNDILNEDSNSINGSSEKGNKVVVDNITKDLVNYIDGYLQQLINIQKFYKGNDPPADINKGILDILEHKDVETVNSSYNNSNTTKTEDDHIFEENEYGVPKGDGRRIFKGKRTKIKYFPFMVSIHIFNQFQCGGSIIQNDLVITAASCLQLAWNNRFYRENPSFLSIRIGSNYYNGGGESISVLEIYFHPSYNPSNLRNNLAIMRLTMKIRFPPRKKSRVRKIELEPYDNPLPMNTEGITIVGWGAKTHKNVIQSPWHNQLSYSVLGVYPLDDCQDIYSKEYVTDKHFCAGFLSRGSGACNHDVGGPGVVSGYLAGVVSFGSPVCGTPNAPTVFTKVGFYIDWIEEIMGQADLIPHGKRHTTKKHTFLPTLRYTFARPQKNTPFIIKSLENGALEPTPVKHEATNLRDLPDTNIFKEFLKTMFESKEIAEYMDALEDIQKPQESQIQSQQSLRQLNKQRILNGPKSNVALTTEFNIQPIEYATKTFDGEPMNQVEFRKTKQYFTKNGLKAQESLNYVNNQDLNDAARKELKNDIMKLIDSTDLKDVFKETLPESAKTDTKQVRQKDMDSLLTFASDNEKEDNGVNLNVQLSEDGDTIPTVEDFDFDDDTDSDQNFEEDKYEEMLLPTVGASKSNDYNYRKHNDINDGDEKELISKKLLFDVISEVIGAETNRTVNN